MAEQDIKGQNLEQYREKVVEGVSKIENPTEILGQSIDQLANVGGFDLLEMAFEGVQNMNPERKARKKIFLTESSKKDERESLKKILELWATVLTSSDSTSDMVEQSEKNAIVAEETLGKNLKKAIETTKDLEKSYRTVALFFKNAESDKIKNITFMNAELEQLKDLDDTRFIDMVNNELVANYDRLDLRDNYSILVVPGYLGSNTVIEKWAKIALERMLAL